MPIANKPSKLVFSMYVSLYEVRNFVILDGNWKKTSKEKYNAMRIMCLMGNKYICTYIHSMYIRNIAWTIKCTDTIKPSRWKKLWGSRVCEFGINVGLRMHGNVTLRNRRDNYSRPEERCEIEYRVTPVRCCRLTH